MSLAFSILGALSELVVAIASSYILNVDMATLKTGFYFMIGNVLSKFLTCLIISIIRIGKHALPIGKLKGLWVYFSLLPIVSVILVFVLSDYMYTIVGHSLKQTICIVSIFLLITVNVLLFYVIDKMINYFAKEQELNIATQLIESQKKTYRELYDSQTEIKKLRHDLKNVMIGILHEISNDNIENAKAHIKKQCELLDATSGFVSGNSIIDALINIKKETADSVGVTLSVDTQLSHQIGIDSIDLVVLLGNALDNAIEATAKCQKQTKAVDVVIITKNSNLLIVVKNPIEDAVDINNLVTTKTDKNAHGFGVLQMQSLAQKYGGEVLLDCNESEFKTTVILSNSVNE